MKRIGLAFGFLALAACQEDWAPTPSGHEVTEGTVLLEEQPTGEIWLILRLVVPAISETSMTAEEIATDTDAYCANWRDYAGDDGGAVPDQIVVQLMAEPVERGQSAPGVRQFFAGYRYEDGSCIWEDF